VPKESYDINQIFAEIEQELMKSLKRNLSRHMKEESLEGFNWPAWQALKLKDMQRFRSENQKIFAAYQNQLDEFTQHLIKTQYAEGINSVASDVAEAINDGAKGLTSVDPIAFFRTNDTKILNLINAVQDDTKNVKTAALRMMDDQYRKIVLKAQIYSSSGAGTLTKAVDMAAKDFVSAGINCIQYADGRRVNIGSYAEMSIRTANKRAKLRGEGDFRKEIGETLVLVSQYGACSPTCLPLQGRVYVDDVWSGGIPDGKYPRLSSAIDQGLYHPNCRHTQSTYFEGITRRVPKVDEGSSNENYAAEQKQRYNERMIRRYKRLAEGSLDEENATNYFLKQKQWERVQREHLSAFPQLRRNNWRENISSNGIYNSLGSSIIYSSDIQIGRSLGAAAFTDKVLVPGEGLFDLVEGSTIKKVVVFAGQGKKKPVLIAESLSKDFGGAVEKWNHVRGEGVVDYHSTPRKAEIHWFENEDVGRYRMKVKVWFDEN